jgi:hypothetical protein
LFSLGMVRRISDLVAKAFSLSKNRFKA